MVYLRPEMNLNDCHEGHPKIQYCREYKMVLALANQRHFHRIDAIDDYYYRFVWQSVVSQARHQGRA